MALGAIPSVSPFLLQKILYPALRTTLGPPCSTGGGILNLVAAVIIGLSTLGGIPELAPQAFCPIVQPTADKLLGRGFDFLLQAVLYRVFFLDFLDVLSPPRTRNRAASTALLSLFYDSASISDGLVVIKR